MMHRRILPLMLFALLLAVACGDGNDQSQPEPQPVLWNDPQGAIVDIWDDRSALAAEFPWISNNNAWWQRHDDADYDEPRWSRHGYVPVGNGQVFAFLGATIPVHTLHGAMGPTYQVSDKGFFTDVSWRLYDAGAEQELEFSRQSIWRVHHSGVVVTTASDPDSPLIMNTLTFAPRSNSNRPGMIFQALELINTSDAPLGGLTIFGHTPDRMNTDGPSPLNIRDDRVMTYGPVETEGWAQENRDYMERSGWVRDITALAPGDSMVIWTALRFAGDEASLPPLPPVETITANLQHTHDWWQNWFDDGLTLDTPDIRVNHLFDSFQYTIKVQQSAQGAVVPMSHYSSVWIRDSYGPARFFFRIGRVEDATDMIEYYHLAAAVTGDIRNAQPCDLDTDPAIIDEPDWLSMGPMGGRDRGEGPSYIPLMYREYLAAGGDPALVKDRLPFLIRALTGQEVTPEGFMCFSGDETYRPGMAMNMGLDASYAFEDECYSANSAFLFLAASRFVRGFIDEHLGDEASDAIKEAAQLLLDRETLVEPTLDASYWLDAKGYYSPYLDMETRAPQSLPAPDVNTKLLWLGLYPGDDTRQQQNLTSMYSAIGTPEGLVQNSCGDPFEMMGFRTGDGLYTGMAAGYWLYALKEAEQADRAGQVFNTIGNLLATPSGNVPEDGVYGSFEPLQLSYIDEGKMGELWARCRPWEGAIVAESLLYYLTALPVGLNNTDDLRPSLPNQWNGFCLRNAPLDGGKKDVCIKHLPDGAYQATVK